MARLAEAQVLTLRLLLEAHSLCLCSQCTANPFPYSVAQMNDAKSAAEYNIVGGSVLHLVLALRGGR